MGLCSSKALQQQGDAVLDADVKPPSQAVNKAPAENEHTCVQSECCGSPAPGERSTSSQHDQAAAAADGTLSPCAVGISEGHPVSGSSPSMPTVSSSQVPVQGVQQATAVQPSGTPEVGGGTLADAPLTALTNGSCKDGGSSAAAGDGDHVTLQQLQPQQQQGLHQPQSQQPRQWDRAANVTAPSALANTGCARPQVRSVKFVDPVTEPVGSSEIGADSGQDPGAARGRACKPSPRRSISSSALRTSNPGNEVSEAVLAKQAEILRSNKAGKLRMRRGGLDSSFAALQAALNQDAEPMEHLATRAAGLKHIGFGPYKRENQDEFFIQVGEFGGVPSGNLFCVFDGHGTHGKDAALYSRQLLPHLLNGELNKYFRRVDEDSEKALRGAVEVLITEAFGETERSLTKSGVNLASSGTTASVAFQRGNRLWMAAAGDSRAILCTRNTHDQWRALPLTIDHRPRRPSERERIEAAGARVAPKRLPSGRSVGEPRLWLQDAGGPGLLLSRSLGDLTAATVGCTSDPEVTFTTLRPHMDHVLVMATDGVWDVLTNEQVCDIVVESSDPHIACRRVLDAALYEWEERMSADNITVLVVEFQWNEDNAASVDVDQAFRADNLG